MDRLLVYINLCCNIFYIGYQTANGSAVEVMFDSECSTSNGAKYLDTWHDTYIITWDGQLPRYGWCDLVFISEEYDVCVYTEYYHMYRNDTFLLYDQSLQTTTTRFSATYGQQESPSRFCASDGWHLLIRLKTTGDSDNAPRSSFRLRVWSPEKEALTVTFGESCSRGLAPREIGRQNYQVVWNGETPHSNECEVSFKSTFPYTCVKYRHFYLTNNNVSLIFSGDKIGEKGNTSRQYSKDDYPEDFCVLKNWNLKIMLKVNPSSSGEVHTTDSWFWLKIFTYDNSSSTTPSTTYTTNSTHDEFWGIILSCFFGGSVLACICAALVIRIRRVRRQQYENRQLQRNNTRSQSRVTNNVAVSNMQQAIGHSCDCIHVTDIEMSSIDPMDRPPAYHELFPE